MFVRIVVVALVIAAMLAVSWLGFFFFRDSFALAFPLKGVGAAAMRSGEIPYWNFQYNAGQPFAGNPNTLTFHPLSLLYLVLPVHVAFNLHYLIHIAVAAAAMHALCRARGCSPRAAAFGAAVYALSGVVISSTCFYNLIVYAAMIPLALAGVERRSAGLLGIAFGIMALAAEPVVFAGATLLVAIAAFRRLPLKTMAVAIGLSIVIASPMLLAFSEIAGQAGRTTASLEARNVLATALSPLRIAELFVWPLSGFLNDPGGGAARNRMFSTIFVGLIALPALFTRSRYVVMALVMLFVAAQNPVVTAAVERFDWMRIGRYPEKLVIPLTAVLAVLIAEFFQRTRFRAAWALVTLLPLAWAAVRAMPIDWWEPYRLPENVVAQRVFKRPAPRVGDEPARVEYRRHARALEPLYGMPAGISYVMVPSFDSMDSAMTRIVTSRFFVAPDELKLRWLQIHGARVPNTLPPAMVVPRTIAAKSIGDAVRVIESPGFDPRLAAVAPVAFESAPARITKYEQRGQTLTVDVEARGQTMLLINQTFYPAWVATMNGEELPTLSLDVDRLGVVVPGSGRITLRFGRLRAAIAASAALSLAMLVAALAIEIRQRRAGEVERAADHD